MQELNSLTNILERFLGETKDGVSDNGQTQFNCPACAEDKGLENGDGKYNLEVNVIRGKYRCWACEHSNEMVGKLSTLIKRYGGDGILKEFRDEVSSIKKSKEYEFNINNDSGIVFDEDLEIKIELPDNTYDFMFNGNEQEQPAIDYLVGRGITENIIKKFNLKYTTYRTSNKNFRNRIIIPSYDKYGKLNYYTGRDYTGKSFRKYFNLEDSNRKDIIFNENFINWDADVVIVEGPTDHLVIPNSIPLLGKSIKWDYYLYDCIIKRSTQRIIIFLDADAMLDANELCKRLSNIDTCGRLYIVPTNRIMYDINQNDNLNLKKLDPSELFKLKKQKGISMALRQMELYECM